MARGDFPLDGHRLKLRAVVARPRVRAEVGVPLNDRKPGGPTMQIKETSDVSFPGVIGSGLRLLECQSDAAHRKAIVGKMQEAITRGALLSRQLLDAARPCRKSIDGFVAG